MARKRRNISESGYYHIFNRGINKQIVYEDDGDYENFINLIRIYSQKYNVDILAYCLMDNHFHLLIYDEHNNKSKFLHGLKQVYTIYFNNKYSRQGPLFGSRYNSWSVESDEYALVVFCYILLNPVRSKIAYVDKYKWNSYHEYFRDSFINKSLVNEIIGSEQNLPYILKDKIEDNIIFNKNPIIDYITKKYLKENFHITNPLIVSSLNKDLRNSVIKYLRSVNYSYNNISRITGVSVGVIKGVLN